MKRLASHSQTTFANNLSIKEYAVQMNIAKTWVLAMMSVGSGVVLAESAPEAPVTTPESTLSYNAGLVSEYRYRGISQSRFQAALQGGLDYAHRSGFYVGAWASTISWIHDAGTLAGVNTQGPLELDLYGGYKGEISKDLSYDLGYLRYEYLGNTLSRATGANADTDELYAALSWGPLTAKYSQSISNLFGTPDSKNSGYLDVSANLDLGKGWSLVPHVGRQLVKNNGFYTYDDYSLTLNKDLGQGLSLSATALGTDAKTGAYLSPFGQNLGRNGLVIGAKYSF